ncbi:MAG TPA: outer membrane beta-barrel protein, partial [Bacteroidales bacterium]|nr:outer membrane beta-barrel protein [Bacteroidales bacterium]
TVQLLQIRDSSVFHAVTDENGLALFRDLAAGRFSAKISYVGYRNEEVEILLKSDLKRFVALEEEAVALEGVTVTARRPLISQEDDKMIVDPTPMIGISTNTLEVIEATPGIYVDYDAGIFLSSTTPAVIYINGREQKLSNQDLMNLLRNLPPGSIERIEILRTPSTKYDAASSGGIVNVVLKKGLKIGRFGNINVGMNQGKYGNRIAGANFNNSGDKTTLYLNVGFNRHDRLDEMQTVRLTATDTTLNQQSETRQTSDDLFLGYGLTWDPDSLSGFSYDGRFSFGNRNSDVFNHSFFADETDQHLLESQDQINTTIDRLSLSQDIGYRYKIDTLDSECDTRLGFDISRNTSAQHFISEYTFPYDTMISGLMNNHQNRIIIQLASDLTLQLKNGIKTESGLKGSWQQYNSNDQYFSAHNTTLTTDTSRDNSYTYNEGIFAAYTQASKTVWGGLVLKAGCRLEYTYMNGQQKLPYDTSFLVNRADLFPYLYISRDLPTLLPNIIPIKLRTFLIYRRTIARPEYGQLNPSHEYVDPYLYEAGNPDLKPQFTNNIEFNISYQDMPILAFGINYTQDVFSAVVYEDPNQNGIARMTYDNLGKNTEKYMRGMIGVPPGGRYFFALGTQYNLNNYDGFYEGEPLKYERGSWRFFTFHSLKLTQNTKFNISGFMMVKGSRGFYELGTFGSLNAGLSQTFMNQKLIVTINARDILGTMNISFNLNQGSIPSYGERYRDSQRVGINIRFNFGLPKREKTNGFEGFEED